MTEDPLLLFPVLKEHTLREKIISVATILQLGSGTEILKPGQFVKQLPLVIKGSIKVIREDEEGKEILIYYIKQGESCALSLSAYLHHEKSQIKAITTEDTLLMAIPTQYIDDWQRLYPSWQEFMLRLYHSRFHELLASIDAIAFKKIDERLLHYLSEKKKITHSNSVKITHQQIADDLGTSREVISRLLKDLEKKGLIELGRNNLHIKGLV